MVVSSRGILAIGSELGRAGLPGRPVARSKQQDGIGPQGGEPGGGAACLRLRSPRDRHGRHRAVFKSYDKVKVSNKEFNAALMARKNELMKIMAEAQEEAQMLAKLTPGTEDFKKHENRVTELKARHEAGREQAEREFAQREAEAMATLYKEVQADGREDRPVAQDELRRQGLEPADLGGRSQLGDGGHFEHDGLCRPAQRHHQRRDLQPQSILQGHRQPGDQGGRRRSRRRGAPGQTGQHPPRPDGN